MRLRRLFDSRRKVTPGQVEQMREAREMGETDSQIARSFGISTRHVGRLLGPSPYSLNRMRIKAARETGLTQ